VPAVYREPADQMGPLRPRQSKVPRASSVAAHSRVAQLVAMARHSGRPVVLQDSTAARTRRETSQARWPSSFEVYRWSSAIRLPIAASACGTISEYVARMSTVL